MEVDLQALSKALTDQGKIIEAGWVSLRLMAVPKDASQTQLDEMRNAFFAGAQHLFSSMMTIMEPGEEPTDKDMDRMSLIQKELDGFISDFQNRNLKTEGNA